MPSEKLFHEYRPAPPLMQTVFRREDSAVRSGFGDLSVGLRHFATFRWFKNATSESAVQALRIAANGWLSQPMAGRFVRRMTESPKYLLTYHRPDLCPAFRCFGVAVYRLSSVFWTTPWNPSPCPSGAGPIRQLGQFVSWANQSNRLLRGRFVKWAVC